MLEAFFACGDTHLPGRVLSLPNPACRFATSPFLEQAVCAIQGHAACASVPAGGSIASNFSEISLTLRCGAWSRPGLLPVKFTCNGQTLYRYLWGISPFPVEANCPHLRHPENLSYLESII